MPNAVGLATCKVMFRQLDAPQLLNHALGLGKNAPGRFTLLHLYYDLEGPSSVAEQVDTGLCFRSLTYQTLFAELAAAACVDAKYLEYLRCRCMS